MLNFSLFFSRITLYACLLMLMVPFDLMNAPADLFPFFMNLLDILVVSTRSSYSAMTYIF